jgi:iron complex transport system permease protein
VISGLRLRLLPAPAPGAARTPLVLVTTSLVGVATFVVTLGLGEVSVAPADVVRALIGQTSADGAFVVTELRLPRALVACCVGAGLAAAGVVLQGLTRNALAAPELVGVSAGAHGAAVVVIVLLPDLPIAALPACAFAGALATSALVYGLSWRRGTSGSRLLLVGIAVTTVGYAVVLGVVSTVENLIHASQLVTFMAGSVYGRGWPEFGAVSPWLAVLLPLVALSTTRWRSATRWRGASACGSRPRACGCSCWRPGLPAARWRSPGRSGSSGSCRRTSPGGWWAARTGRCSPPPC